MTISASSDATQKLLPIYDASLARWSVAFEELDVPTRFGTTHVIATGDPKSPPLVMLHPMGIPAFVWRELIASLSAVYRCYAIDTIGDINKSVLADPERHPYHGSDYSDWLCDVVDALELERTHVLGWSMGGFIALHFAADYPERVRRLALLAPMGLPSWSETMRVLFRLMSAATFPSALRVDRLITWAIGDSPAAHDQLRGWMRKLIDSGSQPRLGNPLPLSRAKLQAIDAPTVVLLGDADGPLGGATSAAERARRYLRDVRIEILPNATHALPIEHPIHVAEALFEFLGAVKVKHVRHDHFAHAAL